MGKDKPYVPHRIILNTYLNEFDVNLKHIWFFPLENEHIFYIQ